MTASVTWEIHYPAIGEIRVRGFNDPKKSRDHAAKHFLKPGEYWEDLVAEGPKPRELRSKLETSTIDHELREDETTILDRAAEAYIKVVKNSTSGAGLYRAARLVDRPSGTAEKRPQVFLKTIQAVAKVGIYLIFIEGKVSHLATAYRPLDGLAQVQGRPTRADFLGAAGRKLAWKLERQRVLRNGKR